jgi:hypothetical protein
VTLPDLPPDTALQDVLDEETNRAREQQIQSLLQ